MILFVYFDKDIFTILTISIVIFFQPNNKRLHKTNKVVNVRNILHKSFYCFICIARLKDYSNKKAKAVGKLFAFSLKLIGLTGYNTKKTVKTVNKWFAL